MKFVFVIHPLEVQSPLLARLPQGITELLMLTRSPTVVGETGRLFSRNGALFEGIFVSVPLLPRMFKYLPSALIDRMVVKAIGIGRQWGARIAGLGALTGCYGDAGVTLDRKSKTRFRIPVTTGKAYVVATAVEAAMKLTDLCFREIPAHQRVLGIAGTDTISQTCLELLRPAFGHVVLFSRSEERGCRVVSEFCLGETHTYSVVGDPRHLQQAHVIVIGSDSEIIGPEDVSPGTLIIDVVRQPGVSVRMQGRDDVLVIEGGAVAIPDLPPRGFPNSYCNACLAETIMDALEGCVDGSLQASTVGELITTEDVATQRQRAKKYGFELVGYLSSERLVTSARLKLFSSYAYRRRPYLSTASYCGN